MGTRAGIRNEHLQVPFNFDPSAYSIQYSLQHTVHVFTNMSLPENQCTIDYCIEAHLLIFTALEPAWPIVKRPAAVDTAS